MKTVLVAVTMALCGATMAWADTIDLGTWTGDLNYQMTLANPASGGTPYDGTAGSVSFYPDHIYLGKYSGYDEVAYQFKADSPIIDRVTVDLDRYDWTPEYTSGATNTFYINVNGTVAIRVDLPLTNQSNVSLGSSTVTFADPTDTVFIRFQRYLRWGGDSAGMLDIFESAAHGTTPWVFHAVPEPATTGLLCLGGVAFLRRRFGR